MRETVKIAFAHNNINPNTHGIMAGITEYIHNKADWQLIVWPDTSEESLVFLKNRGCKGAFVSTQTSTKAKELLKINMPVVAVHTMQDMLNLPFVTASAKQVAKMASEYYLKRKFTNFAFFGLTQARWSKERLECFSSVLAKSGFTVNVFHEEQVPLTTDSIPYPRLWIRSTLDAGQQRLLDWLRNLSKPVAILASSDLLGCHLMNVAIEGGFNVPDEIAILGVNNDPAICNICDPPLSSIALNFKKAGYAAAKLLDKIINGKEAMQGQCVEIQPTHVESRGSTDIFALDDPDIVQALKFIRQNSDKPLQVNEIANHVCVSKRSLQLKFQKLLGRSIHEEIVQAHFEIAKAMLLETNLSIDEISQRSGFLYTSNMRRAFKQITGVLPQKYRKQSRTN
ncbi:MAG: DNA-binding transcriptional regulator [Phycisphaerae bacterium]